MFVDGVGVSAIPLSVWLPGVDAVVLVTYY